MIVDIYNLIELMLRGRSKRAEFLPTVNVGTEKRRYECLFELIAVWDKLLSTCINIMFIHNLKLYLDSRIK